MKTRIIFVLLAALTAGLCSCNGGNDPQPKPSTDFDKMIGTWTLNSYTEKWVNIDADKVEKDRTVNRGSLTIKKEKDGNDSYYTYTENFVNEEGTEYSGRIEITNGCIILSDPEGFMRGDGDLPRRRQDGMDVQFDQTAHTEHRRTQRQTRR